MFLLFGEILVTANGADVAEIKQSLLRNFQTERFRLFEDKVCLLKLILFRALLPNGRELLDNAAGGPQIRRSVRGSQSKCFLTQESESGCIQGGVLLFV